MSGHLFFVTLWREARGSRGRLLFLAACVAVGVAAVVSVAALGELLEGGLRARSRDLLGGDVAVESRRPLGDVAAGLPSDLSALPRAALAILPTMVRNEQGTSRLAELKAVDTTHGPYPLAGALTLRPSAQTDPFADDGAVWAAPELLSELGLSTGDSLFIGEAQFRIRGRVEAEPDPLSLTFRLGPRILMTRAALDRTGLLGFGSRTRYRVLFRLPDGSSAQALARLERALLDSVPGAGAHVAVETHTEAQPAVRKTMERLQRYLGLVALLSLLVAGVGVAQIVATWLAQATPRTAILRCLGLRPRDVFVLYLGHIMALALLGSVLGAALGAATPLLLAHAQPELLPRDLAQQVAWFALLRGVALGTLVPLLFSLVPLLTVYAVSPASVLRAEAQPLPVSRALRVAVRGLLAAGLFAAALLQARDATLALVFTASVALLTLLLWLATRALLWSTAKLPRARVPLVVWQGVAALARPGAGTAGSIVALGLGTLVVLAIALVESALGQELETVLPEDAPTVFLLDIQPDQWDGVRALSRSLGATHVDSAPVAMARLLALDGRTTAELLGERAGDRNERARAQWVLTREQRISWSSALPRDNRIVAGDLWSDPDALEVSLEAGFARDLGADIGSTLRFDVQGVPLEFRVTSLRDVEWRSFSTNFFIVVEPGALEDAPHFRLGAIKLPGAEEQALQNALAERFPNVTTLRVRSLLERLSGVLGQAAMGVRLLGGFAVVTGFVILLAAVAASEVKRARQTAIMKALGVSRRQIVTMFAVEYALRGAVAGLLGAAFAYALATSFTRGVLDFHNTLPWLPCIAALLLTVVLSVVGGLLASARALTVPPSAVLRR